MLRRGAKTDPLWLLRALIASLLIFAASGPLWLENPQHTIQVWFDDSFSMLAMENNRTRKELAIDELLTRLKTVKTAHVKIYSLTDPTYLPLLLAPGSEALWKNKLDSWVKIKATEMIPPQIAQMSTQDEHWLVTDAANQPLNDWLTTTPIHQVIQVGQSTENSAITLLSIRSGLKVSDNWKGLISLNHYGLKPVERTLELVSGSHSLKQWTIKLIPEQSYYIDFDIDFDFDIDIGVLPEQQLLLRFVSPDDLPEDDQLSVLPTLPVPTHILGICPTALITAINAHPFLNTGISASSKADLNIVCGDEFDAQNGNVLRFHSSNQAKKITSAAVWLNSADKLSNLFLQQDWLAYSEKNHEPINSYPVLVADKTSLITLTESPSRTLDCYLDMNYPEFIHRPEYPALVAGLIDRVLGNAVLDNILSTETVADESRITPLPIKQSLPINSVVNQAVAFDLTPYLIMMAIIMLLVDAWMLRGKRFQQRQLLP